MAKIDVRDEEALELCGDQVVLLMKSGDFCGEAKSSPF